MLRAEKSGAGTLAVVVTSLFLLAGPLLGCSPEERVAFARAAAHRAIARGDPRAAVEALRSLRARQGESPEAQLEVAQLLVLAGEAPEAVWLLDEAVQTYPDRSDLRLALADAALLVSDPSAAKAAVQPIANESAETPDPLVTLARAELELGDLDAALQILEETERRFPRQARARVLRIRMLLTEKRLDEARDALREAQASDELEEGWEALHELELDLCDALATRDDGSSGLDCLRRLVDEDPSDVDALVRWARVMWIQGRLAEALARVEAAREKSPELYALYPLAAQLNAIAGDGEAAERHLRALVERSGSAAAYVNLSDLLQARDEPERASEILKEGVEALPEDWALRRHYAEGLIALGEAEAARDELEHIREAAPEDPSVAYLEARLELAAGNAAAAAEQLERVLPRLDQAATQFWYGSALEALGDREGAARRYGLAIARDPSASAAHLASIRLARDRDDWAAVARHAQAIAWRAPRRLDGWTIWIAALSNLGQHKRAEQAARRFAEVFADRPEPIVLLGQVLRQQGRYDEALEQFEGASRRFEPTPELVAERALTLGMRGQDEEGLTLAREGLARDPDTVELHLARAQLAFHAGLADEGAAAVDRALELDPSDPTPLEFRCNFYFSVDRPADAARDCERYLESRPEASHIHHLLGRIRETMGRSEDAMASYRRAAELDRAAAGPRNALARLLGQRDDLGGALAVAQEAYQLAPNDADVLDTLGWLYLERGLVERSISILEEAHAAVPEARSVRLHLARAYREAGQEEKALALAPRAEPEPGAAH